MTTANKKAELYCLNRFCEAKGIKITNINISRERPDITFDYNNKTIGLEVTSFFKKDGKDTAGEQRQQPLREALIKKAHEIYKSKSNKNIEVSIEFNLLDKISNKLAKKIADLILGLDDSICGNIDRELFKNIPELNFVYINRNEYDDAEWRVIQAYTPEHINIESLQEAINNKVGLFDNYEKFDEMWLLIVMGHMSPAMDQIINGVDFNNIKTSKFDKVYLYKTGYNTVIELTNNN